MNEHFTSKGRKTHQDAFETAVAFSTVGEHSAVSVDHQLSSARVKLIAMNRLKLRSLAWACAGSLYVIAMVIYKQKCKKKLLEKYEEKKNSP